MVLVILRYYATGNFLKTVGDSVGIDKATASRIVWKVTRAIAGLYHQFIKLPRTPPEFKGISQEFYTVARFPKCIGALDCTHVIIISPQIRTRNCIERKFGQWKRRFPILAFEIRLKVEKVELVVIITAVLDNIAKVLSEVDPPINEEDEAAITLVANVNEHPDMNIYNMHNENNIVRHQLINYFNELALA
nr:unnamed protein product [Callosobruchus analis]